MSERSGGLGWWGAKTRRVRSYLAPRQGPADAATLAAFVTPAQLALFRSMHPADQRHGLDVVATLRARGVADPDLLVAGLLHDAGKGRTGLLPRIVHSLGQAYGARLPRVARHLPGLAAPLDRLAEHPELSAQLAARAGCSLRTVELIRWQEAPRDPELGTLLRLADEAN